jgi:hypothetical protein
VIASVSRIGQRFLVAVGAAALASGCNLIIEPDRVQCSRDEDCANRGGDFAGTVCVESTCQRVVVEDLTWGCLKKPPEVVSDPGPFTINFHAQEILTQDPVPGAAVKVCRKIDVECEDPEATGLVTDANGDVSLQISRTSAGAAFSGYVMFDKAEMVSGIYMFNPAVTSDLTLTVQIASPGIVAALTGSVGAPQLEDRGIMLLNVLDCEGKAAAGVSYKSDHFDDASRVFYTVDGLPNTSVNATDATGYGGFVNIIPGTVAVTAELESSGARVDTTSYVVRAGAITYSRLVALGQ